MQPLPFQDEFLTGGICHSQNNFYATKLNDFQLESLLFHSYLLFLVFVGPGKRDKTPIED